MIRSWTTDVVKETLPNGLTVLVTPMPTPAVAVVTHVEAGYLDEPDEWVGISHVLEHMYFKGTFARGSGELARETQLLGGYLNAGTIYDKTVYYTVLPARGGALERAMELQADALMNLRLDPEELRRELEVIVQEAKRKLDSPPAVTVEKLFETLFEQHRIRRWRIGTEEGLRSLTSDHLRSYYESRYTPSRVILGIAGSVDPERALELAQTTYADWDRPTGEIEEGPPETGGVSPRFRVLQGDVERPITACGWRGVGVGHPDSVPLDLVAALLGTGRGSWMSRSLRIPGLASSASASNYSVADVGVFHLSLRSDVDNSDQALARALDLVAKLRSAPPGVEDLERVRAMLATSWARALETTDGRAAALCDFESQGGYRRLDREFNELQTAPVERLQEVAHRHLDPEDACAVTYLPEGASSRFRANWPREPGVVELAEIGGEVRRPRQLEPSQRPRTADGGTDQVEQLRTPGADLVVKRQPGSGLVWIGLFSPHLREHETEDIAGLSRLLVRSTLRGAAGLDAEQLALRAELTGGRLASHVSTDLVGWHITIPVEHAKSAAGLLKGLALEPTLDDSEVNRERALQEHDAARRRDDMFGYPVQGVLQLSFPDDPYGISSWGDPDELNVLTPERVVAWSDRLRGGRILGIAVGDASAPQLLEFLEPLASWQGSEGAAIIDRVRLRPGRGAEERSKEQTALAMSFPAIEGSDPAYAAAEVVRALLGGLAGRLFEELRDRRSLAYTVAAFPWLRDRAGAFLTYIATSPEREDEAREGMLDELRRLVQSGVGEAELERAREYAAGLHELRLQSVSDTALAVMTAWRCGMADWFEELPSRIREVDAERALDLAQRMFDPEARAEFVVRGGTG